MDEVSRRNAMRLSGASLLAATAGVTRVAAAETSTPVSPTTATAMDPRQALVEAAKTGAPEMANLIDSVLPQLKAGGGAIAFLRDKPPSVEGSWPGAAAWGPSSTQDTTVVWGGDTLFVMLSDEPATIVVDGQAEEPMLRVGDTDRPPFGGPG